MSHAQHLVQMANDIGDFFRAQPNRQDATTEIENHIKSFWAPRMREKLYAHLRHGDDGLDELAREAVRRNLPVAMQFKGQTAYASAFMSNFRPPPSGVGHC